MGIEPISSTWKEDNLTINLYPHSLCKCAALQIKSFCAFIFLRTNILFCFCLALSAHLHLKMQVGREYKAKAKQSKLVAPENIKTAVTTLLLAMLAYFIEGSLARSLARNLARRAKLRAKLRATLGQLP